MAEKGTTLLPITESNQWDTNMDIIVWQSVVLLGPMGLYTVARGALARVHSSTALNYLTPMPPALASRVGPMDLYLWEFFLMLGWIVVAVLRLNTDAWADIFGNLAVGVLALVLFPSGRATILSFFTSHSMERLLKAHRILGRVVLAMSLMHAVGYWVEWLDEGTLIEKSLRLKYLLGTIALASFLLIWLTSLGWIRRGYFEVFYNSHLVLFLAAMTFSVLHSPPALFFVLPGVLWWIGDRVVRFLRSQKSVEVLASEVIGPDMVKLVLRSRIRFEAGSYVFLAVPKINSLQWHPFTISSNEGFGDSSSAAGIVAGAGGQVDGMWEGGTAAWLKKGTASSRIVDPDSFAIHIKALGDWTRKLQALVESGESLQVKLDGPYGAVSVLYEDYRTIALISGGVGVTPMVSLLLDTWEKLSTNPESIRLERVHFVWVIPDLKSLEWFQGTLRAISASRISKRFLFSIYITRMGEHNELTNRYPGVIRLGRPRWDEILGSMRRLYADEKRLGVYVCGPETLASAVSDGCAALSQYPGLRFDCHQETFDF